MKKALLAFICFLFAAAAVFAAWKVANRQGGSSFPSTNSTGPTGQSPSALPADTTSPTTPSSSSSTNSTPSTSTSLSTETWQLQGSGHSYKDATHVVENGSTLAYAFHYGTEAGSALSGTTKFYFNPTPGPDGWTGGVRVATNNTTATTLAALSDFDVLADGVKAVCDQMNIKSCSSSSAYYMRGSQAVPLKNEKKVRLFFEANDLSQGVNSATEIFYLDSQDGYQGEDFDTSSGTLCGGAGSMDYAPGGDCALSVAVAANSQTGLAQARQFKIGYPVLDSWLWDESVGTFMVITGEDKCGQTRDGLFYATWDGSAWNVNKDSKSCAAPLVPYAHGPVVVNTGDGTYKVYYEDIMSNVPNGKVTKPLRYITADASRTGDPDVVDFEDWDSYKNAGEVDFLWPDGTSVSAADESGLGDHFIYLPDGLDSEVMYMNLGGYDNTSSPAPSTGLGIAVPVK